MSFSDAEKMRDAIVDSIGRDKIYITAADEVRHFDPGTMIAYYSGTALFGFLRAGGKWLWEAVKKKGEEKTDTAIGKVMDASIERLQNMVSGKGAAVPKTGPAVASEEDEGRALHEQAQQLDLANQALRELGKVAEPEYIQKFLEAGEAAAFTQLMTDNFPESKARRIAAAMTLQVEMRLKGDTT
jgi:hypothetical protein